MTTLSASKARSRFFDLVKRATAAHEIYRIHHRSGDAVLISEAEYDSLVETVRTPFGPGLSREHPRLLRDMKEGRTYALDEVLGKKT